MRRKRFREEQIISILIESAAGIKTEEFAGDTGYAPTPLPMESQVRGHGAPTSASSRP